MAELGFEVHCRQITSIMQLILLVRQFTTFTFPIIHLLYPHTPEKAEQLTLFTIRVLWRMSKWLTSSVHRNQPQ